MKPPFLHYPKRPPFFANRFTRLLAKVSLANEIGPEACYLLVTVAMVEDAKGYTGAVTFFNEQLLPLVGCRSVDSLARVRKRAVEAGWLHYRAGGKGVPGAYWVVVPAEYARMDDVPVDENAAEYRADAPAPAKPRKKGHGRGADTAAEVRREPRQKPEGSAEQTAGEPREKPEGRAEPVARPALVPAPPPKPRPPDELFDAICAVTGADPKVSGSHVGKLRRLLAGADPPYTPAEVLRFADAAFLAAEFPWLSGPVSLGFLEKHVGRVRTPSRPPPAARDRRAADLDYVAEQCASIFDPPPEGPRP